MHQARRRGTLAAALALTGAVALAACRAPSAPSFAGFVDAPVAAVATQVAGRVESIPVVEGDRVQRGQLLAQLDAREREAQLGQARALLEQAREGFKQAEANLAAALPTVRGASADVARAQAALDEAEANYGRTQQLARGEAATPQQLDAARATLLEARAAWQSLGAAKAGAQARVASAMAAVSSARAATRVAEAAVTLAEVQLAQSRLLCPFDGVVVSRNLEEGEWAAPGTPVVTVENRARLWVRLDVEETNLGGIRLGDPAQIAVVALGGRTLRGHVMEIGAEADFALNRDVKRGRPDIRTFRVRVAVDEGAGGLRPGMTAEVTVRPAPPGPGGEAVGTAR
jgi:multidrug resistance efflux pump